MPFSTSTIKYRVRPLASGPENTADLLMLHCTAELLNQRQNVSSWLKTRMAAHTITLLEEVLVMMALATATRSRSLPASQRARVRFKVRVALTPKIKKVIYLIKVVRMNSKIWPCGPLFLVGIA